MPPITTDSTALKGKTKIRKKKKRRAKKKKQTRRNIDDGKMEKTHMYLHT